MPKIEYIPGEGQTPRAGHRHDRVDASKVSTVAECDRLISETITGLTKVRQDINFAKRTAAHSGRYADPGWLSRAEAAKHALGQVHQELTKRRAELVRAAKSAAQEEYDRRWHSAFSSIVREHVGATMFEHFIAETKRRVGPA